MADTKTKRRENKVTIVGYLKENNLEQITDRTGNKAIRGSLTIATDKISSHKISFYVSEKTFKGEDSQDYIKLVELLPDRTTTIASYLRENDGADFDTAAAAATKVWVFGRFEEYTRRDGERESSIVSVRGQRAGLSKNDKGSFTTKSEFDVDVYIDKMTPEIEEEKETGRIIIDGLLPRYNGTIDKISFIAVTEDGVAAYIKKNYHQGDTVHLKGDVVNMAARQMVENKDSGEFFGRVESAPQYETRFIHERRVIAGSKKPIRPNEDGCISANEIKDGLAARELVIEKNSNRSRGSSSESTGFSSSSTPSYGGVSGSEEMDF